MRSSDQGLSHTEIYGVQRFSTYGNPKALDKGLPFTHLHTRAHTSGWLLPCKASPASLEANHSVIGQPAKPLEPKSSLGKVQPMRQSTAPRLPVFLSRQSLRLPPPKCGIHQLLQHICFKAVHSDMLFQSRPAYPADLKHRTLLKGSCANVQNPSSS